MEQFKIDSLKKKLKTNVMLICLHTVIAIIWLVCAFINFSEQNWLAFTLNSICVICWVAIASLGYVTYKKVSIDISTIEEKQQENEKKIKKERDDLNALNFFSKP